MGLAEFFQKRRQGQCPFSTHGNSINCKQKIARPSLSVCLYLYLSMENPIPSLQALRGMLTVPFKSLLKECSLNHPFQL